MNNLVVTVSLDSSTELLRPFADIIILDKYSVPTLTKPYDTVYIRSHFSQPAMTPQAYRDEILDIVKQSTQLNPRTRFIDDMNDVDAIVAFEDKWLQYKTYGRFMPRTELYIDNADSSTYTRPIYKKRISSRGSGVTWDAKLPKLSPDDWIVQESLDIIEELRIYVVCGEVYSIAAVRQNKTSQQRTKVVDYRKLTQSEIEFAQSAISQSAGLDFLGLDAAYGTDGKLILLEINRSPGFAKLSELTGTNLAGMLYEKAGYV